MKHIIKYCKYGLIVGLFCLSFNSLQSQGLSSDSLLILARKAAFEEKDHEKAKQFLLQGLQQSPRYADLKIFLGRLHAWNKQYDTSRLLFREVLTSDPAYTDASVALSDLEYWDDKYNHGLLVVKEGLVYNPKSVELWLRKAKFENALRNFSAAQEAIDTVLLLNKGNSEARSLAGRIRNERSVNSIGISYDHVYFDKQFDDPWRLASLDYGRRTKYGSVMARVNYANRFKEDGYQFEVDAYPKISKTFYGYVSGGYSDNVGVFPHWRFGASLYANLPASFEAEAGVRYLYFSDPTFIYTAALGKYYKNFLFGLRAYLTPSQNGGEVSQSYNASARYYFSGADDFIAVTVGTGISPDERIQAVQYGGGYRLRATRAGISGSFSVKKLNIFSYNISINNQEYLPGTRGNQVQAGVAYTRRF